MKIEKKTKTAIIVDVVLFVNVMIYVRAEENDTAV